MPFNEKQDIKLIRAVRENNLLYDTNHPQYTDFNAREVIWQKIGDQLRCPADYCKARWVNIRDINRRNIRRNMKSESRGNRCYKYYSELLFLKPYYKDISLREDHSGASDFGCNDDNSEDEPLVEPKSKKKPRLSEPDDYNTITQNENDNSSQQVDAFLLSIGTTLKKFSPYHLNLAKSQIFAIVQEHELQQIVKQTEGREEFKDDTVGT